MVSAEFAESMQRDKISVMSIFAREQAKEVVGVTHRLFTRLPTVKKSAYMPLLEDTAETR